ncbi:Os01g0885500, partial [Oryza sativa Japonica Group]
APKLGLGRHHLCHFDPGLLLLVEDPVVPLLPNSPSYQSCNGVESSSLSFGNLHSLVTKP